MRLRGDDGGRRGTCKNSDDRGNPRWTSATEIGKGLPLKADKSTVEEEHKVAEDKGVNKFNSFADVISGEIFR